MKSFIAKSSLFFVVLFMVLGANAQSSTPIFTCEAIITSVAAPASSSGSFLVRSSRPDGVLNSPVHITSDRTDLVAPALIAQSNGNIVTLVVRPTEGNDTRCRDANEPLLLLGIFE